MGATIFSSLLVLLQLICVIVVVVVACLLIRSRFVIDVSDGRPAVKWQIILLLVFGFLSIYSTVSGVICRARLSMCVKPARGSILVK